MNYVKYTRSLGNVIHTNNSSWKIIGQDGGQSIPLTDGVLFVFSDTLLTTHKAINTIQASAVAIENHSHTYILPNCAGISKTNKLTDALSSLEYFTDVDGYPRPILVATEQEQKFSLKLWPEHGIQIGDKVYLYYMGIKIIDPKSSWGFKNIGSGIAEMSIDTGKCERILCNGDWKLWPIHGDDFHFGVQVIEQSGYVYVFGSIRKDISCVACLARVLAEDITKPDKYEFLINYAPSWSNNMSECQDLGECGSDYSISYNAHIKKYLMVYINEYTKCLTVRTAKYIYGPYSEPETIASVPHKTTSELVYLGFEHPVFSQQNGKKIFISYCQPHFSSNSIITVNFNDDTESLQ